MRRLRLVSLLLISVLLFSACGKETPPPPTAEVLSVMLAAMEDTAQTLPDGTTRMTAADPASPDYLSETFFSALYGEAAGGLLHGDGTQGPPVTDAAMFLSLAPYPCELAVFRCADGSAARTVAGLCRGRLDRIARGYAESEWSAVSAGGRVTVEGNYVLLILCEDPTPVQEAAARVLP